MQACMQPKVENRVSVADALELPWIVAGGGGPAPQISYFRITFPQRNRYFPTISDPVFVDFNTVCLNFQNRTRFKTFSTPGTVLEMEANLYKVNEIRVKIISR